jgi:Tol biopolymer transport system component
MDADGTDQVQLTFDPAFKDQVPDWSPDGTKISYAAGDPGDILVMNADRQRSAHDRRRTDGRLRYRVVA